MKVMIVKKLMTGDVSPVAMFVLTIFETPTSLGNTTIRVEKNIHSFSVTRDVGPGEISIVKSEMSEICAVPINYLNIVHQVWALQLKICKNKLNLSNVSFRAN